MKLGSWGGGGGGGTGQIPTASLGPVPRGMLYSTSTFTTAFQKRPPLPQRDGQQCLQIVPHLSREVKLSPDGNHHYNSGESESSAYKHPLSLGRRSDVWTEGNNVSVCLALC